MRIMGGLKRSHVIDGVFEMEDDDEAEAEEFVDKLLRVEGDEEGELVFEGGGV